MEKLIKVNSGLVALITYYYSPWIDKSQVDEYLEKISGGRVEHHADYTEHVKHLDVSEIKLVSTEVEPSRAGLMVINDSGWLSIQKAMSELESDANTQKVTFHQYAIDFYC